MLNLMRMLTEWGRKTEKKEEMGNGSKKRKKYYGGQWLRVRRENSK